MTASSSPTASSSRTATLLLRQPRQVQGYRELLHPNDGAHSPLDSPASEPTPGTEPPALTMLWIPPGRFWMGSPETEPERLDREGPQHLVQLQGFFMGQTPISQAQWRQVATWTPQPGERWGRQLDPQPSFFQPRPNPNASSYGKGRFALLPAETNSDLRPVDTVSWHDAIEFCSRLSQRTGRNCTLPAEAQWEYACRAATTTPFHFGATLSVALANYNGNFSYANGPKGSYRQQTTPVAMFPANAWGLHDMHGNVWEWCLDHWHDSYQGAPTDGSPWLSSPAPTNNATTKPGKDSSLETTPRLLRGGSCSSTPGSAARPAATASSPSMPSTMSASVWSASPRTLPLTLKPSISQHWLLLNPGCWLTAVGYWLLVSGCRLAGCWLFPPRRRRRLDLGTSAAAIAIATPP